MAAPWAALSGISGFLGGLMDWAQGMADQEEWRQRTDEALSDINATSDRMMHGTDDYKGILDIVDTYTPQYGALAVAMANDANAVARNLSNAYDELTNLYDSGAANIQGTFDAMSRDVQGRYAGLEEALNQAYGNRTSTAMGMLEGAGEQAKADIRQDYRNLDAAQQQALVNRGLGNTILGASMKAGTERQAQDALGRLNEILRQQKLDTYGTFSGDELANRRDMGVGGVELATNLGKSKTELSNNLLQNRVALGQDAASAVTETGKWAADREYMAGLDAVANAERLAKDVLALEGANLDRRVGASLDFGLPPQAVSFLTTASPIFAGLDAAEKSKPRKQSSSPFSFGMSI